MNVTTTLPALTRDSLTNGQAYEAQVRATNGVGQRSTWSPSGTATPQAEVPDAVQVVVLTNLNNGMRADWGEPEANGATITGYRLQFDDNSSFSSPTTRTLGATTTTRTETGLTEGTTYYFRARASNSAGNGDYSPTASLERDDLEATPGTPTALAGTPRRPLIIDWVWEVPADNGGQRIESYDHQWRYSGDAWSGNTVTTESTYRRITVADATNSVQARVRARNSVGQSSWSGTVTVDSGDLLTAPTQRHRFTTSQTWNWPYDDLDRATMLLRGGASTAVRNSGFDITLGDSTWEGGVSDGTTLWFITRTNPDTAFAYNASTRAQGEPAVT